MKISDTLKTVGCVGAMLVVTACGSTKSMQVTELTKQDKMMNCQQLELEMTEAEFFRDRAEKNRGLSFKNVVMPLGYASTYMSADSAVEAASGRLEYLSRLHEVKGCANQGYAQQGGYQMAPNMVAYHQPMMPVPYGGMSAPVQPAAMPQQRTYGY